MIKKQFNFKLGLLAILSTAATASVNASTSCPVSFEDLTKVLKTSVKASGGSANGGLDFHMWATVVTTDGTVCSVTKTGDGLNDQWLGSRVISAQKANTAISFSTPKFALSTANLYSAVQPGGSLFGLQLSNPVDTSVAYAGNSKNYGTKKDPLVGKKLGGVNVFGGGVALYNAKGELVGALGVSGDTSCADHNIAWRVRKVLALDKVPAGVNNGNDNIIYLKDSGKEKEAPNGFKHPTCGGTEEAVNQKI